MVNNKKISFFYGWSFGFGYFFTNLYWIPISLTFDENFKFLIPFAVLIIPGFLALFYAFVVYLFAILKPKSSLSSFFLFSLIFGIIELIRGSILTGFPWNLIAYSFSNQIEILNIISIIGTYSFNIFCISLFTCPALFILSRSKKNLFVISFFIIITISFYFSGSLNLKKFDKKEEIVHDYKIRLVSSNISIERFYNDLDPISVIKDLIELSSIKKDEKIMLVWAEGILPGVFQDELAEYKWLFKDNLNKNHLLSLGIKSRTIENQRAKYFNSFSIYDHNLEVIGSYNKINLVPFGEFLPIEKFLKKIGLKSITNNYQSFSKGKSRTVIEIKKNNFDLKILPLICYEIIYSGKIFKNSDFNFIINISEDGWFGQSIGPEQHFVHSIYRAIESGKYVLRSSNNGITAIVNPLGVVEKQVDQNKSSYIDFIKSKKISPTLFSQYGNKIFVLIILLYIFFIFSFKRIKDE